MHTIAADIVNGIYVRVGGAAGSTNGLSYPIIDKMFSHLQELVILLSLYELQSDAPPNPFEFQLELFDFKPGSAVPAFRIKPNPQQELHPILEEQRTIVADKFNQLFAFGNDGGYQKFFNPNGLPEVRHAIAEELFGFTISAGNSPISIVVPAANGEQTFTEVYKVPKFTPEQSEYLLKPKKRRRAPEEPEEILGLIQRIGNRKRIIDLYENKDTTLSIAPITIALEKKTYELYFPLTCTVYKEDGNFVIQNEMLDLYAAGETLDEAEHDLYNEFDESYQLLNSINDDNLSERLLRAKLIINTSIKSITEH